MSAWTDFTNAAVTLGTQAAQNALATDANRPAPAAPAAPAAAASPKWLIPAIIGGVVLLIVGFLVTRK